MTSQDLLRRLLDERLPTKPRAYTKNWGDKKRAASLAEEVLSNRPECTDMSTLLAEAILTMLAERGMVHSEADIDELCGTIVYLVRALETAVVNRREDVIDDMVALAQDLFTHE